MKLMLFVLFAFSANAMAAARPICNGNKKMAKEAMLESLDNRFGGPCRLQKLKKTIHWPSEGREGYGATAVCPGKPKRRVSASIQKEESTNSCRVRFVTIHSLDGSQCGLTDEWGGESNDDGDPVGPQWQFDDSKKIRLQDLTAAQIRALPALTKRQIVASVDEGASNIQEAVQKLVEGSEGEEAYVLYFEFKGESYVATESYPGGNPVGKIFKANSDQPYAENGDGSISCED